MNGIVSLDLDVIIVTQTHERDAEIKKKFPDYESFKDADISKIFTEKEMQGVLIFDATNLETSIFINKGNFCCKHGISCIFCKL